MDGSKLEDDKNRSQQNVCFRKNVSRSHLFMLSFPLESLT